MIKACEERKERGLGLCTSNLCGWNHSAKEVKPAFLSDIQFFGRSSRKRCLENAGSSDSKRISQSSNSVAESSHNAKSSNNNIHDNGSNDGDGCSNNGANKIKKSDSGKNNNSGSSGESSTNNNSNNTSSSESSIDNNSDNTSSSESSTNNNSDNTCSSESSTNNNSDNTSSSESSTNNNSDNTCSSESSTNNNSDNTSSSESSTNNNIGSNSESSSGNNSESSGSDCNSTSRGGHKKDTAGNSSRKDSSGNSKESGKNRLETSDEEQQKFYCTLNEASIKPAILRIVLPFVENLAPKVTLPDYPKPITEFYYPSALPLTYPELLTECERVYSLYKVTKEQSLSVEASTRDQSSSKLWVLHRTGHITASNFKSAAVTNHCMPSQSLIKRLCYPEAFKFSTAATRWGCTHEKEAREAYHTMMVKKHDNFKLSDVGLFTDQTNPFLGASPDGMVERRCCGEGVVEIKCPYCHNQDLPHDDDDDNSFCMINQKGVWSLKKKHMYYYQVQLQLHVCDVKYADFVVWTKSTVVIERLHKDNELMTNTVEDIKNFFIYGVLPEIIGKWYTRGPVADQSGVVSLPTTSVGTTKESEEDENNNDNGRLWCYCNQPGYGEMIMCDNKNVPSSGSILTVCVYEALPKASGIALLVVSYQNIRRRIDSYYIGIIGGHMLMHAQQTLTILSITASFSSLQPESTLIGRVPCKIVNFCFSVPITLST